MKNFSLCSLVLAAMLATGVPQVTAHERAAAAPHRAVTITVELPMEMAPTAEDINLFTIIDSNADNKKWKYMSNFGGLVSPTNSKADCDDWAITPGIRFTDASTNYELAFTMKHNMRGNEFLSSFEFYIGTAPTAEAMTTLIGSITDFYSPNANEQTPQAVPFAIPGDAGTYYIGIRCVTKADSGRLSSWPCTFQNISVKAIESSAGAPAQPTDVTVIAGDKGALSATVAFTMPAVSMNGKELPAQKPLTATLTSEAATVTATGLPGQAMTMEVATMQGTNALSLQINGDEQGEPMPLSIYTGVVLPKRIQGLQYNLSPDNMTMNLSWNPPVEGEDGGYVDFDALEYLIYIVDTPNGEYRLLTNNGDKCTFSYTMEPGAVLRTVKLKVLPKNAAGISTDDISWVWEDPVYVSDMLGTPWALPAVERFDGKDMAFTPLTIMRPNEDYAGRWMIDDPSEAVADANHSALIAYSPYNDDATIGRVALPKFSTKGMHNVALTMTVMRYGTNASKMCVYVLNHYNPEPVLLGTIDCSVATDWTEVNYPLPAEYQDKEWVQIYVDAYLDDPAYVYAIDSYKLAVAAANDVAVLSMTPAAGLEPGVVTDIAVRVGNYGFSTATPAMTATVTAADGTVLYTTPVELGTLASGAETTVKFAYTPAAAQADTEVTVTATITTPDEVEINNTISAKLHVRKPALPTVTNLYADGTDDGAIALTWSEPSTVRTVTESFETPADFYYGSEMGRFTAVDVDGKSVYKFQNLPMPNEQIAKAFLVVNGTQLSDGEGLEAHSGDKYLMATCPEMIGNQKPDPANDWLISPATEGGSYVSFWVNIISKSYPETFRILTSSTGTEISDFTLLDKVTKNQVGWQRLEYRLPADARYFAINYVSQDMFGMMIDDITFRAADEHHTITSYKVYRDGQLIATTPSTGYKDTAVTRGTAYSYHVTTVTDTEGMASNIATATAGVSGLENITGAAATVTGDKGMIRINGAADAVRVFTAAGAEIYTGAPAATIEIPAAPGLYLVTIGADTCKVLVK